MKLKNQITIYPPPFSTFNGDVIIPESIILSELIESYMDTPSKKTLSAMIEKIPGLLLLASGDDYDKLGDYTHKDIELLLEQKLGNDPAKTLRSLFPKTLEENPYGAGSILSKSLGTIGIKATPSCDCYKHALEMNEKGPDWCEQNIDIILDWLRKESTKRKIVFIEGIAKMLVHRAIKQARIHSS